MPTLAVRFLATSTTLLCLLIPGMASSQSSGTSISTGREDGSYYYIGKRLHTTMLIEHDYRIGVETSSGSIQNLARLADPGSSIGLALTQSDALSRFLQNNAEFANEFIVLGDAGRECVVLVSGKKGGIRSFAQLKAKPGGEISVDDAESPSTPPYDCSNEIDADMTSGLSCANMFRMNPLRISTPLL